jgi:hypothetical protein
LPFVLIPGSFIIVKTLRKLHGVIRVLLAPYFIPYAGNKRTDYYQ